MIALDETHDPDLKSWVESANADGADFPIQNLPFGIYRKKGSDEAWRAGVAIGDFVLDLTAIGATYGPDLNALAGAGRGVWRDLRRQLSRSLSNQNAKTRLEAYLTPLSRVELGLPVTPRDYTDFFTSYFHAHNTGVMFRPDMPVSPNFKWLPIAYHGRASTIVKSGTVIRRPNGQRMAPGAAAPAFGPSMWLDYEAELGLIIGPGNAMGAPISIRNAEDHIFGVVLLNDWSARDIQAFEYQPLGPFLSKSFATTISPWVVTMEALAPFRAAAFRRFDGDPAPMAHLTSPENERGGHIAIDIEAWISAGEKSPQRLSKASYASSYWNPAQLVAHHTSNGCALAPGDILGTGTISGPLPEEAGSLLELAKAGKAPVELGGGVARAFLENGDSLALRASCARDGARRIGFGEANGLIAAP